MANKEEEERKKKGTEKKRRKKKKRKETKRKRKEKERKKRKEKKEEEKKKRRKEEERKKEEKLEEFESQDPNLILLVIHPNMKSKWFNIICDDSNQWEIECSRRKKNHLIFTIQSQKSIQFTIQFKIKSFNHIQFLLNEI